MNVNKTKKNIDPGKIYIGTELECFLVHSDTLQEISREESQVIMKALIKNFGWKANLVNDEIQYVDKELYGYETQIKLDLCYAIFEISTTHPIDDLEMMEKIYKQGLSELRQSLSQHNMMIWPFGVDPASSNLYNLPFKHREELVNDLWNGPLSRVDTALKRLSHITSQQVSIDVPPAKMMPMVNALYKNLGSIINRFANSPLFVNNKLYKEGRYYFWSECDPVLKSACYIATAHAFPPREFKNLQEFYTWIWQSEFAFVVRNKEIYTFKDTSMSINRFLKEKESIGVSPSGQEVKIQLEKNDIEIFFNTQWLDFKPHFDFEEFALEDFLEFFNRQQLDGFIQKFCKHSYIEVRPCSPHHENNAMDIPRYFYDIANNIDQYITNSQKISWRQARRLRDRAILK